jgi:hypothetical protein
MPAKKDEPAAAEMATMRVISVTLWVPFMQPPGRRFESASGRKG